MAKAKAKTKQPRIPAALPKQAGPDIRDILLRLNRAISAVWCSQAAIVNSDAHDTDDDVGHASMVLVAAIGQLEGIHDDLYNSRAVES